MEYVPPRLPELRWRALAKREKIADEQVNVGQGGLKWGTSGGSVGFWGKSEFRQVPK
jgi:hypothetical protein